MRKINLLMLVLVFLSLIISQVFADTQEAIEEHKEAEVSGTYVDYAKDYGYAMLPQLAKEVVKKAVGRGVRAKVFIQEGKKSALSLSDSGMFFERIVAERNIRPAIGKYNYQGNYTLSGEVIRNSFAVVFFVAPLQLAVRGNTGNIFRALGQPEDVCGAVDIYSKESAKGSIFREFSGRTADDLLALERPGLQWLPYLLNAAFAYLFYYYGPGFLGDDGLKRLATSEIAANFVTTSSILGIVALDDKYEKYQIFVFDWSDIFSKEKLKEIFDYSISVVYSSLPTTTANTAKILSIGLVGGTKSLGVKGAFDTVALFINPLVAAGSKAANKLIITSRAQEDDLATTNWKMQMGILSNAVVALPYVFILLNPHYFTEDLMGQSLIRLEAASRYIEAVERVAKDELAAFKQDEQSWLKTIGDLAKTGIPIGGFILLNRGFVENNMRNHIIIQAIALVPALLTTFAAWSYGW